MEKIFSLIMLAGVIIFAKLWTIQANKAPNMSEEERTLFKAFGYLVCAGIALINVYIILSV